ncbi:hypothetical protein BKA23_0640 [Rudaeicoccus suwonensis]|uniref:Lipoprotein n=1 Tax=Rudaeicoccus suwonensis TaxID=657409 RepID=A0A561E8A9_9MICO|nr:hypothetical protein BKA23_0640 [Rudaeicoccus suwonensis]
MVPSRVFVAGLTMIGLVGVAGCGGSSSEAAGSSVPVITPSSKASSTTSTSASPSPSGTAAGAPGVPEPARQHTAAGAEAFARYYIDLVNRLGQNPKPGVLEPLSLDSCKTCANFEDSAAYLSSHRERFSGPQFSIVRTYANLDPSNENVITAVVSPLKGARLDQSNHVLKTYPADANQGLVFGLDWKNGWRVSTIKTDPTATE